MALAEIIDLTKALIRFKSVAGDSQQIKACADFICGYLDRCRITYQRREHNQVPSIAARSTRRCGRRPAARCRPISRTWV